LERGWVSARDEFESVASLALVQAARTYDVSRNVHFATYARHRILRALRDLRWELASRGLRGDFKDASFPEFSRLSDEVESRGRVIGAEPDEPVGTDLETLDAIENWISRLPSRYSAAFRHIYLDGKTQDETARLVGCSKGHISRLHAEVMTWLHQSHGFESET
jgi:RNA polymerase sigma factor (sigma-70 family)